MPVSRNAGSQAGWALIAGGVNSARVDVHRLHQLLDKVLTLVETSEEKEHLYQVAGDLIMAIPGLVDRLELQLDETSYALSIMGEEHLKDRLPLFRRVRVEESVEGVPAFGAAPFRKAVARLVRSYQERKIAERWLRGR